jgi:DNA-binding response OmpR family regulator
LLTRALHEQGYTVTTAENGQQALALLATQCTPAVDVVLLDVLMPELDGYQTLARIKQTGALQHLPVIMISAVDELESVIRCIELGATDYLPKPFNAALLRARLAASLASKRLRDLELEYLEQVGYVTDAAVALEAARFVPDSLNVVAARTDALGQLAQVFQRMAHEVHAREEHLKQQVQELRIEIDTVRQARKVAEITESEYFQRICDQAEILRSIMKGSNAISES